MCLCRPDTSAEAVQVLVCSGPRSSSIPVGGLKGSEAKGGLRMPCRESAGRGLANPLQVPPPRNSIFIQRPRLTPLCPPGQAPVLPHSQTPHAPPHCPNGAGFVLGIWQRVSLGGFETPTGSHSVKRPGGGGVGFYDLFQKKH